MPSVKGYTVGRDSNGNTEVDRLVLSHLVAGKSQSEIAAEMEWPRQRAHEVCKRLRVRNPVLDAAVVALAEARAVRATALEAEEGT